MKNTETQILWRCAMLKTDYSGISSKCVGWNEHVGGKSLPICAIFGDKKLLGGHEGILWL